MRFSLGLPERTLSSSADGNCSSLPCTDKLRLGPSRERLAGSIEFNIAGRNRGGWEAYRARGAGVAFPRTAESEGAEAARAVAL